MILYANSGVRGVLVNANTGERIPFARWANLETGEFEALVIDAATGRPARPNRVYRGRATLRFVASHAPPLKAPQAAPVGEAAPTLQYLPQRGVPLAAFENRPCERPTCLRKAAWKTAEQRELPPAESADGTRYEQAAVTRIRFWCDFHYQWPTLRHADGEIENVEVKARPE